MAMLVDGVAKIISGSPFPSKQKITKAHKVVEFLLAAPALDIPTLAERDELRADKEKFLGEALRWSAEALQLQNQLHEARLEIEALRRGAGDA